MTKNVPQEDFGSTEDQTMQKQLPKTRAADMWFKATGEDHSTGADAVACLPLHSQSAAESTSLD